MSKQQNPRKEENELKQKGTNSRSKSNNRGGSRRRGNYSSKSKKREDKMELSDERTEAKNINDSSFYYQDPNVLSQITNFSFNQFSGIPVEFGQTSNNHTPEEQIMNIMSVALNPCVPARRAAGPATGIVTAAMRNYTVLSATNSKSTIYAPQDVLILQLALSEEIKIASWLKRALGVSYLFNYRNRDYPDKLLTEMCINPTDMRDKLAQYRVRFNTLLNIANAITFPGNIPCFVKAWQLYEAIYTDSDNSAMAQTYILNPYSTWLFDEAYDTNGSGLRTIDFCIGVMNNFSHYLDIFENMVTALLTSSTLNAIYSDIMRLVTKGELTGNYIRFDSIPDNYVCPIGYNPEIELWLHNAVVLGLPLATADQFGSGYTDHNDLSSDANKNAIIYNPQFKRDSDFGENLLLDFMTDQVTEEMKVAATRLSARWNSIQNNNVYFTTQVAFMDEYIVRIEFASGTYRTGYASTVYDTSNFTSNQATILDDSISKFDWAPYVYWIDGTQTDELVSIIGDTNYYTVAPFYLLTRMYDYEVIHFYQIG